MAVQPYCNSLFSSMSYRVGDILVDPGDDWEGFEGVEAVLLTHGHFDHIYGLNEVCRRNPEAKVFTNEEGAKMLTDAKKNMSHYHETPFMFQYPERVVMVSDGEEVDVGVGLVAKAVFTPGHHPSCVTWVVGNALFTGDAYILGCKTVTNLPGGDKLQAEESLKRIRELALGMTIYPGHQVEEDGE